MKSLFGLLSHGRRLLSSRGRRILSAFVVVQFLLALLDTVALYLISTVFAKGADSASIKVDAGGWTVVIVIALFAARSLLSTFATWRTMNALATEEVDIGHRNFVSFVQKPAARVSGIDLNDLFNAVDRGPGALVSGVILSCYSIVAELLAGFLIMATLVYLQPITALTTCLFFVLVALFQHRLISHRSTAAGREVVASTHDVYDTLADVYFMGKVLTAMPSRSLIPFMRSSQNHLTTARVKSSFLAILPRYFMELVLAFGLALVTVTTYFTGGQAEAVRSITVFAAAGFRLLPMVNRVQSLLLQVLTTMPTAMLATNPVLDHVASTPGPEPRSPDHILEFEDVTFSYPNTNSNALSHVTLSLRRGLQYAVIGPSGAGKTTLVDLAIGLISPSEGIVRRAPDSQLGYVPQETHIAKVSLAQNIALEWSGAEVSTDRIESSIANAGLLALSNDRGHAESLGGSSLSGGQKQRVGLARAFYRSPTILFLDEVTSALDAETEETVMKSVHALKGRATVVVVAHRLTTVQHADEVIYVDDGRIAGVGSFDDLRKRLPQLQRQIELGSLHLAD